MLSRNRTILFAVLGLIALAWIAKLVWHTTIPYRSARLAAKIKDQADRYAIREARDLLEESLPSLTLADEYSCKVRLVLKGWYEGPSREQVLDEARQRGVSADSLLTWKMEFALDEAFNAPFHGYYPESNALLKRLAQEAHYRRPDDSLTFLVRAMSRFQFREYAQCRKLVDPALSQWPESFRFRLLKGRCLVAQGKHDSALLVFPNPDSVYKSEVGERTAWDDHRPIERFSLLNDWYGAALVGSHGVSARQFRWDVEGCRSPYTSGPWMTAASGACKIHRSLHPTDTASGCLEIPADLDAPESSDMVQKLLGIFGGPPRCPDWVEPARTEETLTKTLTEQERTDCMFGTGDSTKDAKCQE